MALDKMRRHRNSLAVDTLTGSDDTGTSASIMSG